MNGWQITGLVVGGLVGWMFIALVVGLWLGPMLRRSGKHYKREAP